MRKNSKFSYHETVRRKLTVAILLPSVICALLWSMAIPLFLGAVMNNIVKKKSAEISERIRKDVNEYIFDISKLEYDRDIIDFIDGEKERGRAFQSLYDFRNTKSTHAEFLLYSVVADSSIYSDEKLSNLCERPMSVLGVRLMQKMKESDQRTILLFDYVPHDDKRESILLICHRFGERQSIEGFITFVFDRDYFSDVCVGDSFSVVIENNYGGVVFQNSPLISRDYTRLNMQTVAGNLYKSAGNLYVAEDCWAEGLPLKIICLFPCNYILSVSISNIFLAAGMLLVEYVLIKRSSCRLERYTMRPLDKVFIALEEFTKGDTDYRISADDIGDFDEYVDSFNRILDLTDGLLKNNTELVNRTRSAELKALQEQFRPHFMFNMLATINYELDSNPELSHEMILSLSKMLRYSLDQHGGALVCVKDDMEYISEYLMLEKIRFGDMFNYHVQVEPECERSLIPKLIMQPVIENSISHGYTGERKFEISVDVFRSEKGLEIVIEDNGTGIEARRLEQLRREIKGEDEQRMHIGLVNTNKRIITQFGSEYYGLEIRSVRDVGTRVLLKLAYIER